MAAGRAWPARHGDRDQSERREQRGGGVSQHHPEPMSGQPGGGREIAQRPLDAGTLQALHRRQVLGGSRQQIGAFFQCRNGAVEMPRDHQGINPTAS
jgi:hypothetical protein